MTRIEEKAFVQRVCQCFFYVCVCVLHTQNDLNGYILTFGLVSTDILEDCLLR